MTEIKTDAKKRNPSLNIIIPIGVSAILILTMIITMIAVTAGNGIRSGVYIAGIDVSKMDKPKATEIINEKIGETLQNNTITVEYEGENDTVSFNEFLNGYKVDDAIEQAYSLGRNKNVFSNALVSLSLQFNKKNIQLEPILDESFITQFMDAYALKLDTPLKDNTYKIESNKLKLQNGKKGYSINKEKATEDIKNILMLGENGNIIIDKVEQEPNPFDIDTIYNEVCTPPVNAKYEVKNGKGYLIKAQNGYSFNIDDLKMLIEQNKDNNKAFYLPLQIVEPEITSVNTDNLFNDILGEYTSKITDNNSNRLTNVFISAERINNVILNPDEVFYYLRHVEPITVAGGYKVANVYVNGKIEQDIGGGVCQVSSALYSAVLYADLSVVRRYNHSLTVGYVPYGQDATVASGEIDFRFKNNTNAPIKIIATADKSGVNIKIMGEKADKSLTVKIENVTVQTNPHNTIINDDPALPAGKVVTDVNGKTGYVVDTYKNYYRNGKFVERVFVSKSVYKALDTVQRRGIAQPDTPAIMPEIKNSVDPMPTPTPSTEVTPKPKSSVAPTNTPSSTVEPTPAAEYMPIEESA